MADELCQRLEAAVLQRPARRVRRLPGTRHAGVAVVLDPLGRVLLTRRARRTGDRWSGHVSCPGGMAQVSDRSLLHTAQRETLEETGLTIGAPQLVGALRPTRAVAHRGLRPMLIHPYLFRLQHPGPELTPGDEVTRCFWLPLPDVVAGSLKHTHRYKKFGRTWPLPAWRYDGEVIWGLTYDMISALLALAR